MKALLKTLALAICLAMLLAAAAAPGEADAGTGNTSENITSSCKFKVSEGSAGKLTDAKLQTTWRYENPEAWIGVKLPNDKTAGYFRIEWEFEPTGFELIEYDAQLNAIRTQTLADTFPCIQMVLPLQPETKYVQLKMTSRASSAR